MCAPAGVSQGRQGRCRRSAVKGRARRTVVASLEDVSACKAAGLAGVIVGKALYEGKLDLAEAVRLAGTP